jgi:hypothetical protein
MILRRPSDASRRPSDRGLVSSMFSSVFVSARSKRGGPLHRRSAATAALLLALAAPSLIVGCEDQSDPKVYLGPVATSTFTAPPVYTPGTPTATPTATGTGTGTAPVLVEPPPAVVSACPTADASGTAPPAPLPASASAALAVSVENETSQLILFAGATGQSLAVAASCPATGGELPLVPVAIADVGQLVTLDARGLDLVAGTTALSARVVTDGDGTQSRTICALAGAKSVAVIPGAARGYAVTGAASLHVIDWTSGACEVTPVALPSVDPDGNDVVGTTHVVTSSDGVPWLTTISLGAGGNGTRAAIARVRRFDVDTATFDDLAPVIGGQPGTLCGADATAVSEGGGRLAVLDGTCGRLVVFDANSGELVSGASLRAKAIAPLPGTESFLTVESSSGLAVFHRVD